MDCVASWFMICVCGLVVAGWVVIQFAKTSHAGRDCRKVSGGFASVDWGKK